MTYVNAPVLAEQRGVAVRLVTEPDSGDFRNVTTLRGTLADGTVVSVSGTLTGPKMVEKLVGINGYDLEVPLSDHMLVFEYSDRPGVIGNVGRILGDAGINIGGMQVSRQDDQAIGVLNVDSAVPPALVASLSGHRRQDVLGRRPAGLTARPSCMPLGRHPLMGAGPAAYRARRVGTLHRGWRAAEGDERPCRDLVTRATWSHGETCHRGCRTDQGVRSHRRPA